MGRGFAPSFWKQDKISTAVFCVLIFMSTIKMMNTTGIIVLSVIAIVALYAGYLLGFRQGKEIGILEQASMATPTPVTPTPGVDTGYKNPFEGVKLNPFR